MPGSFQRVQALVDLVPGDSSPLSGTYPTSGEPIGFPMPDEDVTLTARFEQDEGPGPGTGGIQIEGDSGGMVGEELSFTATAASEDAELHLVDFIPPQGSALTMDTIGIDLPDVAFIPDVPGPYVFVFVAASPTAQASGEWTVNVLPAELRITSIDVRSGTVTLRYEGDAASVQGTADPAAGASWAPVASAVLDPSARTATLPAGKPYLRLSTEPAHAAGVQLWKNGPYWAETNIGADNPEDYGLYFWWGDTIGYSWKNDAWVASDGSSTNFSFDTANTPTAGMDTDALLVAGWITADGVLAPEHDAAQAHWGGTWRMPTDADLKALLDKCDWGWTSVDGVDGWEVRGRGNYGHASIFLPAAGNAAGKHSPVFTGTDGFTWSSVPDSTSSDGSWSLAYWWHGHDMFATPHRYFGFSVRPVR